MENKQNEPTKEKSSNTKGIIVKTAVIGAVAGILGGGVTYYGLDQLNDAPQTQTVQNNSSGTATTTSNTSDGATNSATSAYNKVSGAVVSVVNLQKQESSAGHGSLDYFFGNSQSDDSSDNSSSDSLEEYSEGSGVIYMKSNGKGYIVTNNHVVAGSDKIQVILSNGKKLDAKLVGTDSVTDLAVLTIDDDDVSQVASFAESKNIKPGQTVIAIGSPLGSEYATSVTQGIISASNRTLTITDDYGNAISQTTVIQTDAAINPGNSGGPLVNTSGQIIGINSMKMSTTTDGSSVEGMGFAIPSDEVVTIINKLVKDGKITRPQLGIRVASVSELTDAVKEQLDLADNITTGVYVASVTANGSGSAAGMKKGDVITEADGKKVEDVVSLHTILYSHKIGDTISVKVARGGQTKMLSVKLK